MTTNLYIVTFIHTSSDKSRQIGYSVIQVFNDETVVEYTYPWIKEDFDKGYWLYGKLNNKIGAYHYMNLDVAINNLKKAFEAEYMKPFG